MINSITFRFSKIALFLFFALNCFASLAGNSKEQIDSLKNLLNKAKGSDKLELLYDIAKIHLDNDLDDNDVNTRAYIKKISSFPGENSYGKALGKILTATLQSYDGDLDKSLETYNQALVILKKIPKRDVPKNIKIARVYFLIADLYARKYNISKAVDYFIKTIDLSEKIKIENQIPFIAIMKKSGVDPGKDLSVTEAVAFMKKNKDDVELKRLGKYGGEIVGFKRATYLRLGNLFKDVEDYVNATIYLKKAHKLAEEMGSEEPIYKALSSLAVVFRDQKLYDSSIVYFSRALEIAEGRGNIRYMFVISDGFATTYSEKLDFVNALKCYENMNKLLEPINDGSYIKDNRYDFMGNNAGDLKQLYINELSSVRVKMGDICMKTDSLKAKGMDYYKSTILMLEELEAELEKDSNNHIESVWYSLGELYIKTNQHERGIGYINKIIKYYKGDGDKENMLNGYQLLYLAYEKMNDYKNANKYFKAYIGLKDTIFNQNNSAVMVNFQKRLEVEARDSKIDLLNKGKKAQAAEIEKQKFVRNAIIVGLCLVLVLAFVIARSLFINKKKNKLITEQKRLVEEQKEFIEEKSKEISDSINYAKRIQEAILPPQEFLGEIIPDSFIFYKPKDVVSGDFYQIFQLKDELIIVTADCTGHGVPGAFMSMIGNEQLNKIIIEKDIYTPSKILDALHDGIRKALRQDRAEGETRDGMDVALYKLNYKTLDLEYSGANRPLWIIDDGNVKEVKANKQPIGGLQTDTRTPFVNHTVKLKIGNSVFAFTDGFADQFGGAKGKKYMLKNLERLLISLAEKSMKDQKQLIQDTFESWKGNHEQVDDVLVIGIRV